MFKSLSILLIDDDEIDRLSIKRALAKDEQSFELVEARNATTGIALASERVFDVILLDYRLPDRDGLAVLESLVGDHLQSTAILMLSGIDDREIAKKCIEAGAQDFLLKKELNSRVLMRSVRQARHRYLLDLELRKANKELQVLTETDPLTGLVNRRGFEKVLASSLARVRRNKDGLAVLLLDLDDFKSVNDTLGHEHGDALLVEVTKRLNSLVRGSDTLCRLGGDEFVIVMCNFDNDEKTGILAQRIIESLTKPVEFLGIERTITASIGIAVYGENMETPDLLKSADVAMYKAKQEGRNQSQFFSKYLNESVQNYNRLKLDLQSAVKNEQLRIVYQAQVNAIDNKLGGIEALLRWQHPVLGLLSPIEFLDIAEDTGLIIDVGYWVLEEGCRQIKEWQKRYDKHSLKLVLAVNFSAKQLQDQNLLSEIRRCLNKFDLNASSLELEITESALISDTEAMEEVLSQLVNEGVALSLDDFGTGFSSLMHLKAFPISVLKIDKQFIDAIGINPRGELLLDAIIVLAKTLNMSVVAEGVETLEQSEHCRDRGCDLIQGFYHSKPVVSDVFERTFLLPESNLSLQH